jgi:hypothetical protein
MLLYCAKPVVMTRFLVLVVLTAVSIMAKEELMHIFCVALTGILTPREFVWWMLTVQISSPLPSRSALHILNEAGSDTVNNAKGVLAEYSPAHGTGPPSGTTKEVPRISSFFF